MAIENVNIIDEGIPKIVRNRVTVLIAISRLTGNNWQSNTLVVAISDLHSLIVKSFRLPYPVSEKKIQQKHEKCKLFLVALVSDCFGYVFSRPIFNKHFR